MELFENSNPASLDLSSSQSSSLKAIIHSVGQQGYEYIVNYQGVYWKAHLLNQMDQIQILLPGDSVYIVNRQGNTLLIEVGDDAKSVLQPNKQSIENRNWQSENESEEIVAFDACFENLNNYPSLPSFLWILFERLRRRGFPLDLEDYEALKVALKAGFGWSSQSALRELCTAIWAKSLREQEILFALFDQLAPVEEDWQLDNKEQNATVSLAEPGTQKDKAIKPELPEEAPTVEARMGLPPIFLGDVKIAERPFVFEPQFPLSYREVAQAWRRLRRPVRTGPPIELDLERTIEHRCKAGVAASVVLRPRRRNVARLLLLVDRQGSMAPFHRFCEEVCTAVQQAGRFEETALYYFHNVPAEGADDDVLEMLEDTLYPSLDPILSQIAPLTEGDLYTDPGLLYLKPLAEVLEQQANGASVVIISDAGAGRGQYRVSRLLDTLAFLKGLKRYTPHFVWINPLAQQYWTGSTAEHLARHVPMFSLDRDGMYQAVNVLRGQQFIIEKPL